MLDTTTVFYVAVYEKIGNQYLIADYKLNGISIEKLRMIFNISPYDEDILVRDMVYNFDIDENQIESLKPYVNFEFDLNKYDYVLEGRATKD